MTACIRGCTQRRQHADGCDQDQCRGCLPEPAEFGRLCYTCHSTLRDLLRDAAGQVSLLHAVLDPSDQWALTVPTEYRPGGPRLDSDATEWIGIAHRKAQTAEGEPLRIDCIDTAQAIQDTLSQWVEALAEQVGASPKPLMVWRERRSWSESIGAYLDADPPARFDVTTAADWLRRNLAALESQEWIGDDLEDWMDLMSKAHALCPWRPAAVHIPGVPCPSCQMCHMVLPGGMSDVQCRECRRRYPYDRWAIWVALVAEERGTKVAS